MNLLSTIRVAVKKKPDDFTQEVKRVLFALTLTQMDSQGGIFQLESAPSDTPCDIVCCDH
jgi:hypothetical protein